MRRLQNLEACFLGPDEKYHVRWKGGYTASQNTRAGIKDAIRGGSKIVTLAFGYGKSYILSYSHTPTTYSAEFGYARDLKGYYEDLSIFISDNRDTTIRVS